MFNLIFNNFKDGAIPLKNGGNSVSRLFTDFKNLYFNFSTVAVDKFSLKNLACPNIYPLELENLDFENVCSYIPDAFRGTIIKHRIPILIYFPTEGFDLYDRNLWLHRILYQFKINGYRNNAKFLIYGDLTIDRQLAKFNANLENIEYKDLLCRKYVLPDDFFTETQTNFQCFGVNYFERSYWSNYNNYLQNPPNLKKAKKLAVIPKKVFNPRLKKSEFLSYNRHPRFHRLAFLYSIYKEKLNDCAYLSIIAKDENLICKIDEQTSRDASRLIDYSAEEILDFFQKLPNRYVPYEEKHSHNLITYTEKNQFIDTWYSLVTETEISNHSIFLTEKTYKPILNLHPFMIWGSPFSLAYLRSIGYKTFPNMFDESYDLEENPKIRLQMIISEMLKFNKLTPQEKYRRLCLDKNNIIHNQQHFNSRSEFALHTAYKNILLQILPMYTVKKKNRKLSLR